MRLLFSLAWRDLRAGGRSLWIFCACLALGVALVAAGGGLYRQVADSLQGEARTLFGGDLALRHEAPLPPDERAWIEARGTVSHGIELRTMLLTADGRSQLVELQSVDALYPLYGRVQLEPAQPMAEALAGRGGRWGVAVDGLLARRLGLAPGALVSLGELQLEVRAAITQQPDRSLRADWAGAPVLISAEALQATGLVQPLSRVNHDYRVRLAPGDDTAAWREAHARAFPQSPARVMSFVQRSQRMGEVLEQIGSGLMLVGFSALFIGGLGVFNSVQAWLQQRLGTLATLRALGLRDGRLVALVLLQVLMLALGASAIGLLVGGGLALLGVQVAAGHLPLAATLGALAAPLAAALAFGVLTALAFALPPLGRALTVTPAALFRGLDGLQLRTPAWAWVASGACGAVVAALVVGVLPDPRFGAGFLAVVALLLVLLEGVLRGLRHAARALLAWPRWQPPFELRLALAGLQRPGSPLRASLLSLGSSLTLLVACTLVVATLLRTVQETVPQQAPALVFHDVQSFQLEALQDEARRSGTLQRVQTAPLVLGRLVAVNGTELAESEDRRRARAVRKEHKLSHRTGNIDDVVLTAGAWWPAGGDGPARIAMEDHEAEPLGLRIGDRLGFDIAGNRVEAELAAIYAQRRFQARLWLEGILSDGALDPYITRHVGAAWLPDADAVALQDRLAQQMPNVVTMRTEALLEATRTIMGRAAGGLAVIGGICLAASLLVLASVVAASRTRQVYESSVMHALGARLSSLRRVLRWEYGLLAAVTAAFAIVFGSALAAALLTLRLELSAQGLWWTGVLVACGVSGASLGLGAQLLLRQLRVTPAQLLRSGAR